MNYTLNPRSGNDRDRIVDWANRHDQVVETTKNDDGHVVFGFNKGSLQATTAYSSLKRIANFDEV